MMRALFRQKGAALRIDIIKESEVQNFIDTHASVLDSSMEQVSMSDAMRTRLQQSNWVFSGMKTFHELNEAFPSLVDENGDRKPFTQFLNDVQKIDSTYNRNYLRAEYDFVQSSAEMASKWEQFQEDGDRYHLQYRTAHDDRVRPEHAALDGVTLPFDDPFWDEYYPPNGWNCRCTVVQVLPSKYPDTPRDEAVSLGEKATAKDTKHMFRFNPGKEQRTMPAYNPYTISKCKTCKRSKTNLAFVPNSEQCSACEMINECYGNRQNSQRAIERKHYLHEMKPLLNTNISKDAGDRQLNIGFSTYGNRHLFSDTFGRTRVVSKEDLKNMGLYLNNSTFIDDASLTHSRTDGIDHFYYFKTRVHERWVRLNVAKKIFRQRSGYIEASYFVYSVNDINE